MKIKSYLVFSLFVCCMPIKITLCKCQMRQSRAVSSNTFDSHCQWFKSQINVMFKFSAYALEFNVKLKAMLNVKLNFG